MEDQFFFQLQTQTFYGIGISKNIGTFLREKNFNKLVILVDEGVVNKSNYFEEIQNVIRHNANILETIILRGTEEPDYDYLDEIAQIIRKIEKVDVIIGIGGGSCLDITKAVAVLKTNPGKGIDYRGFDKVRFPGIPTVAIPTTAGTGSEVTINAVFTDKKEMRKLGINGKYMNATYAFLDAEWTISCPYNVAISSGMDALTHALESFMCKKSNELTKVFSKNAFKLLYGALPSLVDDPENKIERQKLLLGSFLAGIALFNSGSGIAGALSYPIGVYFKVPHGIAGGIFLKSVLEYNVERGYFGYDELYDVIESGDNIRSSREKSFLFINKLDYLFKKLKVPEYLDQWGITKQNVHDLAKLMQPLQAAFDQNPIPFSATTDALNLLKKHVR